jgi:hypothetical protein
MPKEADHNTIEYPFFYKHMPKLVTALKFPRIGFPIRPDKEVASQLSVQDFKEGIFTDRK